MDRGIAAAPRIAVCLTSHSRVDCARINQELFKLNFATPFVVVHASSGPQREPYLEDALVWCEPKPLHAGAINLLQLSIARAVEQFAPDYLIHLEADTWVLDEQVLLRFVRELERRPSLLLATSAWTEPASGASRLAHHLRRLSRKRAPGQLRSLARGLAYDAQDFATQFFVMRNDRALVDCILAMKPRDDLMAERQLFDAFAARFELDRVLRMREREPVHPKNRYWCEPIALHCQHWPAAGTANDPRSPSDPLYVSPTFIGKKEALERYPALRQGESLRRLLEAREFDYYNPGAIRY